MSDHDEHFSPKLDGDNIDEADFYGKDDEALKQVTDAESPGKEDDGVDLLKEDVQLEQPMDAATAELIRTSQPSTPLEQAYADLLERKEQHILRLSSEIQKLKAFISKRKQTYKRKRKDEGAPTRALSAYNIFVQDRFKQLQQESMFHVYVLWLFLISLFLLTHFRCPSSDAKTRTPSRAQTATNN